MKIHVCLALAASLLSACGSSEPDCVVDTSYDPAIDPAAFANPVDNPLWPLVLGSVSVMEGGGERDEITVTAETKVILGVATIVVHDVVTVDGVVTEDTDDWFAADAEGNVWYFGEDSKAYEDGQPVSNEGSWEAGVDGAKPGMVMPAVQPPIGTLYRQEYAPCVAEDQAKNISLAETITVPYGTLEGCLETEELTALEPDVHEQKYFCPGVGFALEVDVTTGDRVELVERTVP